MDSSVAIETVLDKLPVAELDKTLTDFVEPLTAMLSDERLRRVVPLAVRGIVAGESPVLTAMAQTVERTESSTWAAAKRLYRFLDNPRLSAGVLRKGLYRCARATVEEEDPEYLVVALDPVNFEKPYTYELEGVSTVHKSTPPDRYGKARLARGYHRHARQYPRARYNLRQLVLLHNRLHQRESRALPGHPHHPLGLPEPRAALRRRWCSG